MARPAKPNLDALLHQLKLASNSARSAVHAMQLRQLELNERQMLSLTNMAEELMETRRRCFVLATATSDRLYGIVVPSAARSGSIVHALSPREIDRRRRKAKVPPTKEQAERDTTRRSARR
jgi:hypothetical protein